MRPLLSLSELDERVLISLKALLGPQIVADPTDWWRCYLRSLLRQARGAADRDTLYVDGRFLFDACHEEVVLRGVNKMAVFDPNDPTCATIFPEIARTGANVVRIVWWTDDGKHQNATVPNMDAVIDNCLRNRMIPMIELHDATDVGWSKLPDLVAYWTRPDVVTVLKKYRRYLLLNIGNEVGTDKDNLDDTHYVSGYEQAIAKIRAAGITVPLVIDAAYFGQEMSYILDNADTLIGKDPLHNLIFSLHVWWHYHANASADFAQAINDVVSQRIPFIVGEFSGVCQKCDDENNDAPYSEILMLCHQHSIGWIAWEWGPGNEFAKPPGIPCPAQNMTTNGQYTTLQDGWAKSVAVDHPFSIQKTAVTPYWLRHATYLGQGKWRPTLCECDAILGDVV